MKNIIVATLLLFVLLCTSSEARRLQSTKQCQIGYYDIPAPPSCEMVPDENGVETEQCSAVGSAAYAAVLDASFSSFSENWGLSEVDFSGDCQTCTLQLWSGAGETYVYQLTNEATNVMASDIWSEENESFEIRCDFSTQPQCEIGYYDIPAPPSCEMVPDENGVETEQCSAVGSASYAAILDPSFSSFSENGGLSEVDFSGDCQTCTLQLWNGPDQAGETYVYQFTNEATNVMMSDIWSEQNQSFEIICDF